jgi:virion structural protein|nr:MAG TPA: Thermonuclease [Caudoviricetes sp.]
MADDYLFKGIEAPSDSPADSFVDTVAAAGGLVGAAFAFSRTKRGARVLSKLDPIIGQVERRLSKITDDGANAITLSELEGYANQALRGNFPKPSSVVTADKQTDIIRDTTNRILNLQADAEKYSQNLYHAQVIDTIATDFKDAGVNQATIDNMVDAINSIAPSQRYDGSLGFSERLKNTLRDVVMDGESEHAAFDDTDVALRAIQNLTRKESLADWQSVGSRGEKIVDNFIENQIRDAGELLSKHQAKKTGEVHDFALADYLKEKQVNASIDEGALDVPIVSRNGKRDIIDIDNAIDKIRSNDRTAFLADLLENAKYNDSTKYVDGEILNTPNLDKIKSEARGIVGDTLVGKLFGLDDLSPRNQLGVDVYSNAQFKLGMANFQKEGTLLVRNRDKLYRQDLTTGKMEQMDISGYNWQSANDDIVHYGRLMNQYGVQQEKTNWAQLGRSEGAKRLTDVDGNNLYALRNINIDQLNESELSALGRRAYSHARAVQSIDIDLEKNTEKIVLDLAASKEGIKKDTLSKIRDVYHAKSESAKRRILRDIDVDQVDNLDLLSVTKAARDGKKINARLRDDGIGIGSEALYKIKSVEETVNEAVVKNAVDSLGKTQAEAYAKIDSLNISPGEKQKLKDMYTIEKYKKESGINVIKDRHNFNRDKQDIGSAVFDKIQITLDDSPEADRILGHYLGNGKDIHFDFGKKGNAAAPVLARKSLDVKKIITSWNSGDLDGIMQGISDSAKGLFANSKLSQTTWLGKLTGGHLDFSNNTTGNDLSIAGAYLYKIGHRLSGGLNMLDPGAFTGVVNNWLTRGIAQFINIGHGLGLHENATRSSLEIIDKLLFKRVLPASFLYTQLDWADDTFNLNENFQTGLANIDLGFRKFTDATGLTDAFKLAKMANPMAQYISGDYRPYQSYEERLDYYQNGKDPIRAGRYWVWGSSNEFRGSSISYWEDNSLKLAKSDYKTEGIYGGYFNKWMHSPIPTLSNPLSPLIYALNPYWLEEMHSEDRPYLESGPLFESNTLQGLILNPTLGGIIKPKRKYHEDRMWFGRDVKAVMYHMNQQIQEQSQDTRYLIFQNGRLGVYDFTAFDHPTANEYVQSSDQQYAPQAPMYASAADYVKYINPDGTVNPEVASLQPVTSGSGSAISAMNNAIYSGSSPYINPNGMYIQQRVRRGRPKGSLEEILNNADLYNNLMNSNGGRDYLDELQTTSRLLTGIYGYIGSSVFGRDESKFIANAGDIDSFTRQFWDAGVGGLGGETAEIGRRFLPEFSRRRRVNPLMNTIADQHAWLPEKFYMGDAYTKVINGEARLPGAGYEAINQLHPDQFGSYGAIDRYKILADIAPNSPEYKYWKQIVKMMNSDEAKKVLRDTEEMVKHQGKKHDFFNYKFLGKTTVSQDGHIEEVLSNGKFKIAGDDRLYQIAGVKFKENGFMSKQQLLQVIQPGQRVTMRIDDEERTDNPDAPQAPIRAAVFLNGENISDTLREVGLAEYDMDDSSAAGAYANYNTFGRIFGSAAELVTHAQIPILHSQFMRINDPLEEYRSDQLYGSGFASWEDIVDTMLVPTFEQSKTSFVKDLVADSAYRYYKGLNSRALDNASKSRLAVAKFASTYLDGPALAGEITGRFTFVGANAVERKEKLSRAFRFAGNAFAMATSTDDPMYATYAWGRMGYDIGSHLNLFDKFISDESSIGRFAEHLFGSVDNKGIESLVNFAKRTRASRMLQAAAFAGTGLAIALAKNNPITEALGIDHVYTPDNVEKRWDTEEYFDRLRYIKYMGLYEAAKEKAKAEEGVDVDKLYQHQEALRAEMDGDVSITDMMASVLTSGTPSNDPLAQWINKKFGRLSEDMTTLAAGEWTEQAIMYHQVAESTVYALNKDSEYSDIIRALPSTEKEYFVEFAKVTNEKQRRAILRNVSPSLAKALRLVWYQEETETESNESYFTTHNLPGPLWQGWEASSNLEDIKAKVIYNEGMQFADFGIYSSTYEDPEVINAPNIENIRNGDDPITVRAKINTVLSGIGLTEKQIQVNPTQQDGIIDIVTNVTSVLGYKIDKALSFL